MEEKRSSFLLERFPFVPERFFFLKIGHSLFWNALEYFTFFTGTSCLGKMFVSSGRIFINDIEKGAIQSAAVEHNRETS
jgi:hypothetical protein